MTHFRDGTKGTINGRPISDHLSGLYPAKRAPKVNDMVGVVGFFLGVAVVIVSLLVY